MVRLNQNAIVPIVPRLRDKKRCFSGFRVHGSGFRVQGSLSCWNGTNVQFWMSINNPGQTYCHRILFAFRLKPKLSVYGSSWIFCWVFVSQRVQCFFKFHLLLMWIRVVLYSRGLWVYSSPASLLLVFVFTKFLKSYRHFHYECLCGIRLWSHTLSGVKPIEWAYPSDPLHLICRWEVYSLSKYSEWSCVNGGIISWLLRQ